VSPDFNTLHRKYAGRVRNVIAGILRFRPNDIDDAAQETWLRVWRGLGEFRGDAAPWTWIYRVAVNCALQVLRKESRSGVKLESLDVVIDGCEGEKAVVPRTLTFRDRRAELVPELLTMNEAIEKLSSRDRRVIHRHYICGETYREIARPSGNRNTVRATAFRAVRELRRRITR
jgi:RNA polymerase sigma-70 factor (ECF subfamily)